MSKYPNEWSLPALGVDPNMIVTAGVSSGGYASSQLQFVFSSRIKGAGIFIGGPYLSGRYVVKIKDLPWKAEDEPANMVKINEFYQLMTTEAF